MDAATRAWVGNALRVALAHHPLCHYFDEDVVRVGRARVCSGCAAAMPSYLAGLVVAPFAIASLGVLPAATLALALGLPHLTTYARRHGRPARFAAKAIGGLGLGLLTMALLAAPVPWWATLGAFAAMGVAFVALQLVRMRSIWRTCRACPWGARWDACPGFAPRTPR